MTTCPSAAAVPENAPNPKATSSTARMPERVPVKMVRPRRLPVVGSGKSGEPEREACSAATSRESRRTVIAAVATCTTRWRMVTVPRSRVAAATTPLTIRLVARIRIDSAKI